MSAPTVNNRRANLGLSMATALVIGNMIGSGVFLLPAALAAYGPISLVALEEHGAHTREGDVRGGNA
jgi:amino acid transporter